MCPEWIRVLREGEIHHRYIKVPASNQIIGTSSLLNLDGAILRAWRIPAMRARLIMGIVRNLRHNSGDDPSMNFYGVDNFAQPIEAEQAPQPPPRQDNIVNQLEQNMNERRLYEDRPRWYTEPVRRDVGPINSQIFDPKRNKLDNF